jgi:hypothetical protein
LGKFKYEVVQAAWEAYLASNPDAPRPTISSGDDDLSADERDIISLLREDPDTGNEERDFLIRSVQTQVAYGLDKYRKKWKTRTKAPRASKAREHERQPTGTG